MDFVTHNVNETEMLGAKFAEKLLPGSIVAFYGDLGAGKTAFIRGLASGLGISESVTSPTFTVVNEYHTGRIPLFHFDLYRLVSSEDLIDIGWDDYLYRGGICAVEWSERAEDLLNGAISVTVTLGSTIDERIISVKGIEL